MGNRSAVSVFRRWNIPRQDPLRTVSQHGPPSAGPLLIAQTLVALLSGAIVTVAGVVMFGVDIGWKEGLLMLPVLLVGTLCFTGLGFVVANLSGNEAQVSMISNLFSLPMIFVSEAFYSLDNAPDWLQRISRVLPFPHFVEALRSSMEGDATGIVLPLLILSGFTALFLVMAVVTFRWNTEASAGSIWRRAGKRTEDSHRLGV